MASTDENPVDKWLASIGMAKYVPVFASADVRTLKQVHGLDEEKLKAVGVTVPGHVRRIMLAKADVAKQLAEMSVDDDEEDYADEAADTIMSPPPNTRSLGIASAAPSVKAAAAAQYVNKPKSKFNSTSSLYIDSTIIKPDVSEIVFCVAIVLHDRISEGEEAAELSPPTDYQRNPLGGVSRALDVLRPESDEGAAVGGAGGGAGSPAAAEAEEAPLAPAPGEEGGPELTVDDIFRAVKAIHERAELSSECLIVSLLYVERLRTLASLALLTSNWQPILVASLLVAQKVVDDASLLNADFAQVVSPYSVAELSSMEKRYLELIEYNVSISAKLYASYYFELRTLCEKEERAFKLKPLSKLEAKQLQSKTAAMEEDLKNHAPSGRREWQSSGATLGGGRGAATAVIS